MTACNWELKDMKPSHWENGFMVKVICDLIHHRFLLNCCTVSSYLSLDRQCCHCVAFALLMLLTLKFTATPAEVFSKTNCDQRSMFRHKHINMFLHIEYSRRGWEVKNSLTLTPWSWLYGDGHTIFMLVYVCYVHNSVLMHPYNTDTSRHSRRGTMSLGTTALNRVDKKENSSQLFQKCMGIHS